MNVRRGVLETKPCEVESGASVKPGHTLIDPLEGSHFFGRHFIQDKVIISSGSSDHRFGKPTYLLRHVQLMFRVIDLPSEVDLSVAKATFNDGALDVVMPKAAPAKSVRVETRLGLSAEISISDT